MATTFVRAVDVGDVHFAHRSFKCLDRAYDAERREAGRIDNGADVLVRGRREPGLCQVIPGEINNPLTIVADLPDFSGLRDARIRFRFVLKLIAVAAICCGRRRFGLWTDSGVSCADSANHIT